MKMGREKVKVKVGAKVKMKMKVKIRAKCLIEKKKLKVLDHKISIGPRH